MSAGHNLLGVLKHLDGRVGTHLASFQKQMENNYFIMENYHYDRLFEDAKVSVERENEFDLTWYSG